MQDYEEVAVLKSANCGLFPETHVFIPIAFETPVNVEGAKFLSETRSSDTCLWRSTRNQFPLATPFHLCAAPQ